MKVLVTGGHGFTGRYVQAALLERGHDVRAPRFDITDPSATAAQVEMEVPEAVVHLAGRAFVHSSDLRAFYAVNQLGSFNLLEALARYTPGIPVILASSASVYGANACNSVGEGCTPDPTSHYGVSKLCMELGSRLWSDKLDLRIVRPFNYTGVGQDPSFLIPKIVDHFRRRADSISLGNLDVARDFGDVRTVAAAYAELITAPAFTDPMNLCTGKGHSVRDILAMATAMTGHQLDIVVDPAFVRTNDIPYLVGDPTRLQTLLPSWRPKSLEATLEWMLFAPQGATE